MSRCRFLVDECLPNSVVEGLQRHIGGVVVRQVVPPKGTADDDLLRFCEQERLLLVTADRATMPDFVKQHLQAGGHTWGVVVIGPDSSLSLILEELAIVYEASEADEWIDLLEYMPFSRP